MHDIKLFQNNFFIIQIKFLLIQVCEDGENKRLLLSTFMMLGLLVGSPIGGRLGDRFGRKPTLLGAVVFNISVSYTQTNMSIKFKTEVSLTRV
jgi:MFS family permease